METNVDRSYLTSIAIGFSVSIACVAVSLRFLARWLHRISLGADDWWMMVGAVSQRGSDSEL